MSNKLMMYGNTLCFLKKIYSEFFISKKKKKLHVYPKKLITLGNSRN